MKATVKKRKNSNIIIKLILIAFSVFAILSLANLQVQLIKKNDELAAVKEERDQKQATEEELKDLLENGSKSDLIEKAARDKFDYVYEDEDVITDTTGN